MALSAGQNKAGSWSEAGQILRVRYSRRPAGVDNIVWNTTFQCGLTS